MRKNRSMARVLVPGLLLAVMAASVASGCYSRVVSAKGFGADQYQIQEPYQANSKLDDWVFGKQPTQNNSRLKDLSQ